MTRKRKISIIALCILTALFTLFIWSNSMVSSEGSGALSKSVTETVCNIIGENAWENFNSLHHFVRKAAHFTEFCVLGVLYMLICVKASGKAMPTLVFIPISCTLFTAVTDELIQSFTGRGSSVRDVMLDFSGALTGIIIICLFKLKSRNCDNK